MPEYALSDTPRDAAITTDLPAQYALVAVALKDSRRSIISGALLTKAVVQPNSVRRIGSLDVVCCLHQFCDTRISRASILIRKPTTAPDTDAVQIVRDRELVLSFAENADTYYLVPRDARLAIEKDDMSHFTFMTLRNRPGQSSLQYQVITMYFDARKCVDVINALREHINSEDEVKAKMANAAKQILEMKSQYIRLRQEVKESSPGQLETSQFPNQPASVPTVKKRKYKTSIKQEKGSKPDRKDKGTSSPRTLEKSDGANAIKKAKRASLIPDGWQCEVCHAKSTVMRRRGPTGLNTACNSCGQHWAQSKRTKRSGNQESDQAIASPKIKTGSPEASGISGPETPQVS